MGAEGPYSLTRMTSASMRTFGKWIVSAVIFLAAAAGILVLLFGDNLLGRADTPNAPTSSPQTESSTSSTTVPSATNAPTQEGRSSTTDASSARSPTSAGTEHFKVPVLEVLGFSGGVDSTITVGNNIFRATLNGTHGTIMPDVPHFSGGLSRRFVW
jgi:hypothetical protein